MGAHRDLKVSNPPAAAEPLFSLLLPVDQCPVP